MKKLLSAILLLLTLHVGFSQTRFYLSRVTAPITWTLNAGWTVTSGNTFCFTFDSKTAYFLNQNATITGGASGAVAPQKMINESFCSIPLQAQTLNSGSTISAQMRCNRNSSSGTALEILYVRLCNEDGTNVREIGNASSTNVINGTAGNRTISITVGSNITINQGDRLIFEFGLSYTVGSLTTLTSNNFPNINPAIGDLPVDNTSTSTLNPWVEFSQTLLLIQTGYVNKENNKTIITK